MTDQDTAVPFPIGRLTDAAEADACARLMASVEPWITLGRTYPGTLAIVADPTREAYVMKDGGVLVGFMILDLKGLLRGYVQTLCVAPAYQGRGAGTAFLRMAESRI